MTQFEWPTRNVSGSQYIILKFYKRNHFLWLQKLSFQNGFSKVLALLCINELTGLIPSGYLPTRNVQ